MAECDVDPWDEGNVVRFPSALPTPDQIGSLAGDSDMDALLHKYAAEAERIYANQTAGDYTWLGLLGSFAFELAAARSAS